MTTVDGRPGPGAKGLVLHSAARYYDLLAWLLTLGREGRFRDRLVELARLEPGHAVLDVGCGTGTLAVSAKRRVGLTGTVHGVDASPEMIERARRKSAKAGVEVTFEIGTVEALPFPDARFDAVLSTLMLHHLPRPVRQQCAREMRRVLRPGGRVLAVDFATPARERKGILARFHRHGHVALRDIVELLSEAGLGVVESGSVGVSDLQFAVATRPSPRDDDQQDRQPHVTRSLDPPRTSVALARRRHRACRRAWDCPSRRVVPNGAVSRSGGPRGFGDRARAVRRRGPRPGAASRTLLSRLREVLGMDRA